MPDKLLIFSECALFRIKSGAQYPSHPEDQEPLPGVAEAIARYAADGWRMAIASNQGGCAYRYGVSVTCLQPGTIYKGSDGVEYRVKDFRFSSDRRHVRVFFDADDVEGAGSNWRRWGKSTEVVTRQKTIEQAIAEMRYYLQLLPEIGCAYFCPDLTGQECYKVWNDEDWGFKSKVLHERLFELRKFNYRKPGPGMLQQAVIDAGLHVCKRDAKGIQILFVGDRPEDQQASEAAGVEFMWADEWRKGDASF